MTYCTNVINEWGKNRAIVNIPEELEAYNIGIAKYRYGAVYKTVFIALKNGLIIKWWNDPDTTESHCCYVTYPDMLKEVYTYKREGAEIQFKNVPEHVQSALKDMLKTPELFVARVRFWFKPETEPKFNRSPWSCEIYYDTIVGKYYEYCVPRKPFPEWIKEVKVELYDKRFRNDIDFLLKQYKYYGANIEYTHS
jgi:hypothetical protein